MLSLFAVPFLSALILTACLTKYTIPVLKRMKMGQKILQIGPSWHKDKEGTPTTGGAVFASVITVVSAVCVLLLSQNNTPLLLAYVSTLGFAMLNALIGFIDDMTKIRMRRNEGLTPKQKILLQLTVSGLYLFALSALGFISTEIYIPFVKISVDLGIFYYFLALILILGATNCANLTDGIDGLAGSVAAVISFFMLIFALNSENALLLTVCSAVCGGTLGFLSYNLHPAKIFMGDTGSLFLGAILTGCAFLMGSPLIILVFGIAYVIEGASVIIQVTVYKICKRRVFKMAPIHHHLEKCGLSENGIVLIFVVATALFSLLAFLG
ncbi:MAG: phospho-N-acetylmuramoyl-pentapeptide-transferase [Clostridia bacterium]|nr:phospho-N-acetylmuramoyl-pentapeptide-transferase [Clostridia bacterium]